MVLSGMNETKMIIITFTTIFLFGLFIYRLLRLELIMIYLFFFFFFLLSIQQNPKIHYINMSKQYTVFFHGCKNCNFQMKR